MLAGATECSNRLPIRMTEADDAVLSAVEKTLSNPAVVEWALALAEAELIDDGAARRRGAARGRPRGARRRRRPADNSDQARWPTRSAARRAPRVRGAPRRIPSADRGVRRGAANDALDADAVCAKLRSYVADYRKLLRGHVPQMQQILRRLIVGKLTFTPKLNGDYEFVGRGTVRPLLAGVIRKMASPGASKRLWTLDRPD